MGQPRLHQDEYVAKWRDAISIPWLVQIIMKGKHSGGIRKTFISSVIAGVLLLLSSLPLAAQLPFQQPKSNVLEVGSLSTLSQQYQNRAKLFGNVTEIKTYLSANSPYSMRLSTSTESPLSRRLIAEHIRESDFTFTNQHSHINFGPSQFLVETLRCSPNSYSLNVWDPVATEYKIRSDSFIDGKYWVFMPGGVLSQMEFGSIDAFKKATVAYIRSGNGGRPETPNTVLETASVDFEQYARFQNLGPENVIPNSFVFSGNNFVCSDVHGASMVGNIHMDEAGVVDMISYQANAHFGPRVFLLFYETVFTNATWYPSRILDAVKRGNDLYAIRRIHTVYNVIADQGAALAIPKTTADLYGTNISQQFEWTSNMAYEITKTQMIARPLLLKRDFGGGTPQTKYVLQAFLITFAIISLAFVVYCSLKIK